MKSKEEFDAFYSQELKKLLEKLEANRLALADKHSFKRYKRNLKWMAILCVILTIASAAAPTVIPIQVVFCIPATALYAIIAAIVIAVRRNKAFKPIIQEYKQTVIPRIIGFLDPNLHYKPTEGILQDEFNSSELFDRPSRYKSEDLVNGQLDGLEIRLSDIACSATQKHSNSSSSNHITIFQGLYAIVRLPKKFGSRLLIKPENMVANAIGNFARNLIGDALIDKLNEKLDLTDLELGNSAFDKAYTVRCADQSLAKQILTPPFIQLIMAFSKELNAPVSLAFFENQVHIGMEGIDLFEVDPYTSIIETDVSRYYFTCVNLTLALAKSV